MPNKLSPIQLDIRAKMIIFASNQGLSYQEIVEIINTSISRQRIQQIIKAYNKQNITK